MFSDSRVLLNGLVEAIMKRQISQLYATSPFLKGNIHYATFTFNSVYLVFFSLTIHICLGANYAIVSGLCGVGLSRQ